MDLAAIERRVGYDRSCRREEDADEPEQERRRLDWKHR